MATGLDDLPSLSLQYPDAAAITAAYRELPRRGRLLLSCRSTDIAKTLQSLEHSGFCAIQLNTAGLSTRSCDIRAYKGKQGPCYETGRSARYLGAALAGVDDDNHLLTGEMRVCEKTGAVYTLPPYEKLVSVTEADQELLAQLDIDPVPFDCDTLEADAKALVDGLPAIGQSPDNARRGILYPGPFRVLILSDGTILRRGQSSSAPSDQIEQLCKQDGCLALPPEDEISDAEFLQTSYADQGAACLLGELPLVDTFSKPRPMQLEVLAQSSAGMRERLTHLIEREDRQFILVGSDPRDDFGCCPNDDVGAANRLVEAGILMLSRAPTPPEACPTTLYAFAGELQMQDGKAIGTPDPDLRARIKAQLTATDTQENDSIKRIIRWTLLLFILIAMTATLVNKVLKNQQLSDTQLPVLLQLPEQTSFAIVLMTYGPKECALCKNMDKLAATALDDILGEEFTDKRAVYRKISTEANPQLKERYEVFTSSLFLMDIDANGVHRYHNLQPAADLSLNAEQFKALLQKAIKQFRANENVTAGYD